jgi:hypothetical protein
MNAAGARVVFSTGHQADPGILPRFGDRVARLEALDLPAEIRRHLGTEVIR